MKSLIYSDNLTMILMELLLITILNKSFRINLGNEVVLQLKKRKMHNLKLKNKIK